MTDPIFFHGLVSLIRAKPSLLFLMLAVVSSSALAAAPDVHFDIVPLSSCRVVTTESFAAENPGEMLVETEIAVSTLLARGTLGDLNEYAYRLTSPNGTLTVADYEPKTELASEYASNISVEKKDESTRSIGISLEGAWDHLVRIGGAADRGSKDSSTVSYELHAPHGPITASGTIDRGHGVYFKFRPSRQTTLEGSRLFTLTFRVPQNWRGDYMQIHCQASGTDRGVMRPFDEPVNSGRRDFFLPLYLAGDLEAKRAAERMVEAEAVLQKVLLRYRDQMTTEPRANVLDQFAGLWDRKSRPGPNPIEQVERLIFSHEPESQRGSSAKLPAPVDAALGDYLNSRWSMRILSGK
jgi:hypothetical protein